MCSMVIWVVIFSPDSRRPTYRRHLTKFPSPQLLLFRALTNRDARNPFRTPPLRAALARRIHSCANCRGARPSPTAELNSLRLHTLSITHSPYLFSFQLLAHSFALAQTSTLLFSTASALFAKNHRGWGYSLQNVLYQRHHLDPFACVFSARSRVYPLE